MNNPQFGHHAFYHQPASSGFQPTMQGIRRPSIISDIRETREAHAHQYGEPSLKKSKFAGEYDKSRAERQQPATYIPQVEAISPTPEDNRDLTKKKDEILSEIKQVDHDISKMEQQIENLKKKQRELEFQAANPSYKRTALLDIDDSEGCEMSQNERIFAENRKKAAESHKIMKSRGPVYSAPVYNQVSDTDVYKKNIEHFRKFKPLLVEHCKRRAHLRRIRERYISERYDQQMGVWIQKVDRIESRVPRRRKKAQQRELYEKIFPEIKKNREDKERLTRVGSRGIRSDADMEDIAVSLYEQAEEGNRLKALAVAPPMMLDALQRKITFVNNNGFIEDLKAMYKERKNVNIWSDHEKAVFREKFMQHQKDFQYIASFLERKSVQDCIEFYYLTKKSVKYKELSRRQQTMKKKPRFRTIIRDETQSTRSAAASPAPSVSKSDENETTSTSQNDIGASTSAYCLDCNTQVSNDRDSVEITVDDCRSHNIAVRNGPLRLCKRCYQSRSKATKQMNRCELEACVGDGRAKATKSIPNELLQAPPDVKNRVFQRFFIKGLNAKCCDDCFTKILQTLASPALTEAKPEPPFAIVARQHQLHAHAGGDSSATVSGDEGTPPGHGQMKPTPSDKPTSVQLPNVRQLIENEVKAHVVSSASVKSEPAEHYMQPQTVTRHPNPALSISISDPLLLYPSSSSVQSQPLLSHVQASIPSLVEGSITHGTPRPYDNLLRQVSPQVSDGSITRGTPIFDTTVPHQPSLSSSYDLHRYISTPSYDSDAMTAKLYQANRLGLALDNLWPAQFPAYPPPHRIPYHPTFDVLNFNREQIFRDYRTAHPHGEPAIRQPSPRTKDISPVAVAPQPPTPHRKPQITPTPSSPRGETDRASVTPTKSEPPSSEEKISRVGSRELGQFLDQIIRNEIQKSSDVTQTTPSLLEKLRRSSSGISTTPSNTSVNVVDTVPQTKPIIGWIPTAGTTLAYHSKGAVTTTVASVELPSAKKPPQPSETVPAASGSEQSPVNMDRKEDIENYVKDKIREAVRYSVSGSGFRKDGKRKLSSGDEDILQDRFDPAILPLLQELTFRVEIEETKDACPMSGVQFDDSDSSGACDSPCLAIDEDRSTPIEDTQPISTLPPLIFERVQPLSSPETCTTETHLISSTLSVVEQTQVTSMTCPASSSSPNVNTVDEESSNEVMIVESSSVDSSDDDNGHLITSSTAHQPCDTLEAPSSSSDRLVLDPCQQVADSSTNHTNLLLPEIHSTNDMIHSSAGIGQSHLDRNATDDDVSSAGLSHPGPCEPSSLSIDRQSPKLCDSTSETGSLDSTSQTVRNLINLVVDKEDSGIDGNIVSSATVTHDSSDSESSLEPVGGGDDDEDESDGF